MQAQDTAPSHVELARCSLSRVHTITSSAARGDTQTARTFYLGGITLFFFMVQVITGILLLVYYQPTPDAAYGASCSS